VKRNLDSPLLTLDDAEFDPPATLQSVCLGCLSGTPQEDMKFGLEKRMQLYNLARRVHAGGIVDFTAEEIALLQKRISTMYPTIIMGRAVDLLNADLPLGTA
jgi:hypothetical protein